MSFTQEELMLLELFDFEGVDCNLEISLFEYNVIYSPTLQLALFYYETDVNKDEDCQFSVKEITDNECLYIIYGDIKRHLENNPTKNTSGIPDTNDLITGFFDYLGCKKNNYIKFRKEWDNLQTVHKISDIIRYWGREAFNVHCNTSLEFCLGKIMDKAMKTMTIDKLNGVAKMDSNELIDFFLQYSN